MERYQEEFDRAHLDTLDRVSLLTMEYVSLYSATLHTSNIRSRTEIKSVESNVPSFASF